MMNPNMMNMFMNITRGNRNPNDIINMLVQQNPQAGALLNQLRNSGMSPQQYATQYAKQSGTDISQIISIMRNLGIKI